MCWCRRICCSGTLELRTGTPAHWCVSTPTGPRRFPCTRSSCPRCGRRGAADREFCSTRDVHSRTCGPVGPPVRGTALGIGFLPTLKGGASVDWRTGDQKANEFEGEPRAFPVRAATGPCTARLDRRRHRQALRHDAARRFTRCRPDPLGRVGFVRTQIVFTRHDQPTRAITASASRVRYRPTRAPVTVNSSPGDREFAWSIPPCWRHSIS